VKQRRVYLEFSNSFFPRNMHFVLISPLCINSAINKLRLKRAWRTFGENSHKKSNAPSHNFHLVIFIHSINFFLSLFICVHIVSIQNISMRRQRRMKFHSEHYRYFLASIACFWSGDNFCRQFFETEADRGVSD